MVLEGVVKFKLKLNAKNLAIRRFSEFQERWHIRHDCPLLCIKERDEKIV